MTSWTARLAPCGGLAFAVDPRERDRGGHSRTSEEPTMSTLTTKDGTEISYNAEVLAFLHS